jgi:hypothetical protein
MCPWSQVAFCIPEVVCHFIFAKKIKMFKFLKFTISVLQNLGPLCSAKRVDISGLTFKVSPGTNLFIFFYSDSKPSPFIARQHLNEKKRQLLNWPAPVSNQPHFRA